MNWCDREPDNGLRVNPRYETGSNSNPVDHHCRDDTPTTLLTYSVPDSDSIIAFCTTDWTALYTNWLTHGIDVDGQFGPFISHFVTYPIVMFKGGPLYFEAFGDDDDWHLLLATPGNDPLQTGVSFTNDHTLVLDGQRRRLLTLEFDSKETTRKEGWDSTWWKNLNALFRSPFGRGKFDPDNPYQGLVSTFAYGLIDTVMVIGPWVMDCHHDCPAEVHPVLGLAVLTEIVPDPSDPSGEYIYTWQVFMRSQGGQNQGGGNENDAWLRWDPIDMSFRFTAPSELSITNYVAVAASDFYTTSSSSFVVGVADNQDVILTATQPNYSDYMAVTIRIKWCGSKDCKL